MAQSPKKGRAGQFWVLWPLLLLALATGLFLLSVGGPWQAGAAPNPQQQQAPEEQQQQRERRVREPPPDPHEGFSMGPRAAMAAKLEAALDASPLLGVCHNRSALLPELPRDACQDQPCLWSELLVRDVDLLNAPLRTLAPPPPPEDPAAAPPPPRCAAPAGGQRPLPPGVMPRASLVLLVHGNSSAALEAGARSLLELFLTAREVESAEYLVVHVGTAPGVPSKGLALQTARRLQQLFGIRVTLLEAPDAGAGRRQALRAAQGELVALIDSPTLVARGWLGAIAATFQQQPRAVAVGPLLLGGVGGPVRDAGGIVDAEGRASAGGRGSRPGPHLYMREADYVSPKCIVLRAAAYHRLWGFDPQFRTERYKVADLGMSARVAGLQMLVQPLAIALVPSQNGTEGQEAAGAGGEGPDGGLLEHDRQRLLSKWGDLLKARHCPAGTDEQVVAGRHGSPKLLWIAESPPEPDHDPASLRMATLLRTLVTEGYHVTYLFSEAGRDLRRHAARLRHAGVRVTRKPGVEAWELVEGGQCPYDVAVFSGRRLREVGEGQLRVQCPGVPIVYDATQLEFLQEARQKMSDEAGGSPITRLWRVANTSSEMAARWLELGGDALTDWLDFGADARAIRDAAREARLTQMRVVESSNMTLVGSAEELELMHIYAPWSRWAVVGQGLPVSGPPAGGAACADRTGLLFEADLEEERDRQALEALVRDVLPRVLRLLPWGQRLGLQLHVAAPRGDTEPPPELAAQFKEHGTRVVYHGGLSEEQLHALYHQSKLAVVPLVSGSGLNGKVTQAMRLGLPVVATPLGLEGTYGIDEVDCLEGGDPDSFADKVAQGYTNCTLWESLAAGGYRNIVRFSSERAAANALLQALNSIGAGPQHAQFRDVCQPLQRGPRRRNITLTLWEFTAEHGNFTAGARLAVEQ